MGSMMKVMVLLADHAVLVQHHLLLLLLLEHTTQLKLVLLVELCGLLLLLCG